MIPGEIITSPGDIELNAGAPQIMLEVANTGDRLVVRAMADSGLALRRMIIPVLAELAGAGRLPRLWHL